MPPAKSHRRIAKKKNTIYTTGEKNAIVDDLLHPLQRQHWAFEALDILGHIIVEENPEESIVKFVRYSLPKILRRLMKDYSEQ